MPSTVCSLAEDRRLLAYFAAQAAVGVHNLHLAAELSRHVEEVRDQAAELAASRDRVVAGQDAERRRIQRVLHDGVQQEIVALSARADPRLRGVRFGEQIEAHRLDTVGGSLTITSGAGLGASVCAHIPVGPDQDACGESAGYEPAAGREHADA